MELWRSLEISLYPSFSTFCLFFSVACFFYSMFFGPVFGSHWQRGDGDLHGNNGYWQGNRVQSKVCLPRNFEQIENLISRNDKTCQMYSFILNTKALKLLKNFGEGKSARDSSRYPLIQILGTPLETLPDDRLKKRRMRIQSTQKMLLCICSNRRKDNFCNYTAWYMLGIHQPHSMRKNPNTFTAEKRSRGVEVKLRVSQKKTEIHMRRVIRTVTSVSSWKSLLHPQERKLREPLSMTVKRKIVVLA